LSGEQTNKKLTITLRATRLGLLEQQTSLSTAMELLSLRPANVSSNCNLVLHARSLGAPWPTTSQESELMFHNNGL